MSNIPPVSPRESGSVHRLSPAAPDIPRHQGSLPGRFVEWIRRLPCAGGQEAVRDDDAIRRENDQIIDTFRGQVARRTCPAIAERSLLTFGEDKIHVRVNRADVPQAWAALRPLLLSGDNPFLEWKIVALDRADEILRDYLRELETAERSGTPKDVAAEKRRLAVNRTARTSEGAQFTLYAYRRPDDPHYQTDRAKFAHFLTLLEWALADAAVTPGVIPESDVQIQGHHFLSYRNESIRSRGAAIGKAPVTRDSQDQLRATAFYAAITP